MFSAVVGIRLHSIVSRLRLAVFAAAVLAMTAKLLIAANTFGTNDVHYWTEFARGVRDYGPIGIYGHAFEAQFNHPPLSGWMLVVVNWLVDHGVAGFPFLIRVPSSLADLVTAMLIFELVRLRRPDREAAIAAALVVWSPVLLVISGFHGNTDPLFVMLVLLTVYLLVVRQWTAAAGITFAVALSVKLVPIVLVPALAIVLFRLGWRRFIAFVGGGMAVFVLLWIPVLVTRWAEFSQNVLGYPGIWLREWGLVQFAVWLEAPEWAIDMLVGPGRFVVLALAAGLPAILVWRRPAAFPAAVGLALALFLLLSPAFSMQYLAWPLAGAYLINTWTATAYNLAASVWIVVVYDHWNRARPWDWFEAVGKPFRSEEFVLMVVTWVALAGLAAVGLWLLRGRDTGAASGRSASSSALSGAGNLAQSRDDH